MTATLTRADLDDFKAQFLRELATQFAPIETVAGLDKLRGWQSKLQLDGSFGRILNGPQWIDNVAIREGVITADKLDVNTLNAVTANTGDLNVTGDITIAASFPATGARIVINNTGQTMYRDATHATTQFAVDGSGFIASTTGLATDALFSWSTTGGSAVAKNTLTIGAGGKIIDGDGSFWDQSGITLVSTGTIGDVITWKVSGSNKGTITASSSGFYIGKVSTSTGKASLVMQDTSLALGFDTLASNTLFPSVYLDSSTGFAEIQSGGGNQRARFGTGGDLSLYGKLYPGISSNTYQTTGYYDWNSSASMHRFAGGGLQAAGKICPPDASTGLQSIIGLEVDSSRSLVFVDGGQFYFNTAPTLVSATGASGSTFSPTHSWQVFDSTGATWYVPLFSARAPWAA